MATITTTITVRPTIASPTASVSVNNVSPLEPVHSQFVVIYCILIFSVFIFAFWNVPGVRHLINPFKLFTIGLHELCHIIAAVFTGGSVLNVTIDPHLGGATRVEGGHPPTILAAGYVGSSILGGVLMLGGWDTLVAKVLSFVIGIGLAAPLVLVRDKLTIALTFIYEGLLVGFWFIDHASPLRWYCLFVGIMNIFYVVWDITDDKFFQKRNTSDCTQFELLWPRIPAHYWAIVWILFEVGILVAFTLLGIAVFKRSDEEMDREAALFLPT